MLFGPGANRCKCRRSACCPYFPAAPPPRCTVSCSGDVHWARHRLPRPPRPQGARTRPGADCDGPAFPGRPVWRPEEAAPGQPGDPAHRGGRAAHRRASRRCVLRRTLLACACLRTACSRPPAAGCSEPCHHAIQHRGARRRRHVPCTTNCCSLATACQQAPPWRRWRRSTGRAAESPLPSPPGLGTWSEWMWARSGC